MAKKDKLLRDAIADAKAVRETALANAKAALEEAFTPHLTSMLSNRLKNEADDEMNMDDEDDLEEINDPVKGDAHGSDDGGETDVDAVEKSSFVQEEVDDTAETDAEQLKSSGIATRATQKYGTTDTKEPAANVRDSSDIENAGLEQPAGRKVSEGAFDGDEEEDDFGGEELGGEEETLDTEDAGIEGLEGEEDDEEGRDLDLETIIRELEADITDEPEEDEEPLDIAGEAEGEVGLPGIEGEEGEEEEEPVMEDAADGHGADEGGEEKAGAIEKSSFTAGTKKQTGPISEAEGEEEEDEIDLEEILREIEDEEKDDELETQVTSLRSELKEYRDAVKYLRSKLNEVNLLNAKLLYTNKLFKSYNMDVRQKMRVVENFDRATTIREAKLVFSTLAEAFRGKPVSRKRSITEGLASRVAGSTKPRSKPKSESTIPSTPTILAEGADLAARFKKLAGIK